MTAARWRRPLLGLAFLAVMAVLGASFMLLSNLSGPGNTAQAADSDCSSYLPSDRITVTEVTGWRNALDPAKAAPGIKRWNRVLEALGEDTGTNVSPMTAEQAQEISDWLKNQRWDRTARTLSGLEECAEADNGNGGGNPPPPTPEISISGGTAVTEGGNATYTLSASPAPSADLDVSVSVSQSGDFASSTGTQTVTITSGGSATLTVGTDDDSVDEADGSVTATVNSGSGYTVGSAGAATVAVSDNDVPEVSVSGGPGVTEGGDAVFTLSASPTPHAALPVSVSVTQSGDFATTGTQTVTIPTGGSYTLSVSTDDDGADEANGSVTATVNAGNGYTVGSAGAATVNVADNDVTQQDDDEAACLPADAVDADEVKDWRDGLHPVDAAPGVRRFNRVLEALGVDTGTDERAMKYQEAQAIYDRLQNTRWDRIARTLTAMQRDNCDATPPPADPVVSIAGGAAITEGGSAVFTITASPVPSANLDVTVSVTQSGDFTSGAGAQTVTIPSTGSATLSVGTTNDNVDEADGSVTATVNSGSGYTVSGSASAATIGVEDDDDPAPSDPVVSISGGSAITEGGSAVFTVSASPAPSANLDVTVSVTQSGDFGATTGTQTVTIPTSGSATLSVGTTNDNVDEADGSVTATVNSGSGYTVSGSAGAATIGVEDDDDPAPSDPVVSVSGGSAITEGGSAVFTLTARPAPAANLDVSVSVTQSGDYGAATGTQTVSIPTGGSYTLTVATTNDGVDEADGSVTAAVNGGAGYTVSSTAGSATVNVSDDDVPEISISGGSAVTEGGNAVFTITASPAPAADLDVAVSVTQSGDFTSGAGAQTVTIPTSGSATLSVGTTDDGADETDGSVTATVSSGSGYTVSGTASAATIGVADNDPARPYVKPEISVVAGPAITEGEDAVFTISADPPQDQKLRLFISVRQEGRFLQSGGEDRYFTIPPSGSATLTEPTIDDDIIEDDGTITVYIVYQRGYNLSANWKATLNVADNDTVQADTREPRTDITWADFWAPYEDLITEIENHRDNPPVLVLARQHADFWDRVLLAFGREVDDTSLTAMTVAEAEDHQLQGKEKFDRIAPALKEIYDNGPPPVNPGDPPEQTTAFPTYIPITGGITFKTLTLTDYFSDPEGADLTFTATISGTTMTATVNGADLTLALNNGLSRGGGDLTVTASDGQLTDTATAHVVVGCGTSATWNESWGFCTAAASSNSFSGSAQGDGPNTVDRTDPDNHINRYEDEHTAQVTLSEGAPSAVILVRVYPDVLSDRDSNGVLQGSNDSTCGMRGYLTIQDAKTTISGDGLSLMNDSGTETGTWSVRVTGNGFTNSPANAKNRQGTADVAGTGNPGWNDSGCGNAALTEHKYREVRVEHTLPADDGVPGTDLTGIKLMYHDIGSSGTTVQGIHEVMLVRLQDTIDAVKIGSLSGIDESRIIGEGTGPRSHDLILVSDDKLVGYVAVVVDGGKDNIRPDLTQATSNPQNGWWTLLDSSNRSTYMTTTIWAHIGQNVLPKWSSSGTYAVSTGVWHNNALWIRGASGDYAAGDEPGGANDGWQPLIMSGNMFTSGYAGSNNGAGRATPETVYAWTPQGSYVEGEFVWNEHNTKLYIRTAEGFVSPVDNFEEKMFVAYRDNGPAMQLGLRLSGGGKWPWIDNQNCFFNAPNLGGAVRACTISWNWPENGYYQNDQTLELWWVELEEYDPHAPVKFRTKLSTLTLRDSGTPDGPRSYPVPHTGNYWIEFENLRGSGYSGSATQKLSEQGGENNHTDVKGYIVTASNPIQSGGNNDRVVAVEVRRGTSANGARANHRQPLNKFVGRGSFAINGKAHRDLYLLDEDPKPCNLSGYEYSCFGGEGNWTKVSGANRWRTPINLAVQDDNFVGEKLRYYVFNIKDSTSSTNPVLEVKEDDHLQITLKPDTAWNGKLDILVGRASYQHYSFRLEAGMSVDGETGWDEWDTTIDADWHGSASSLSLGDDRYGPEDHPGCPSGGGEGWVRAVFTNWNALFYGVDFDPSPQSTAYLADLPGGLGVGVDNANTRYSGWVRVCE